MEYFVFSMAVLALCGFAGFGLYKSYHFEKKMTKRLDLVVRASHTCASQMNTACEKLDAMEIERTKNFDYQKKVSEHQRVLLASLNRQIFQLDAQLTKSRSSFSREAIQSRTAELEIPTSALEKTLRETFGQEGQEVGRVSKKGSGVVRLEEMFKSVKSAPDQPSRASDVDTSEYDDLPIPTEYYGVEPRRVING